MAMDPAMMAAPLPAEPMLGSPTDMYGQPDPTLPDSGLAGVQPAPNPFPSTDPTVVAQIMALVGELQSQDHMNLQAQQDGVLQMIMSAMAPAPAGPPAGDPGFAEGGMPLAPPDQMMM